MHELTNLKISFLAGTLRKGGAEQQLFYLLQALRQSGATPRLLCLERGGFWEEPIRNLGVAIAWVDRHSSRLQRLVSILRALRADRPAIFQSQHFYTNVYGVAAARLLGLAEIGAMRSNGREEVRDSGRAAGWLNLRGPKLLAANSHTAIRYALAHGVAARRLYYLPNVVDTARLRPIPSRKPGPVCLLAAGRLVEAKRLDRFIAVLARLRRQLGIQVKGLIAGAGPLQGTLERQAADLGLLPPWLEFKGAVADMAPLYQQADVCALTSDYEGTPNVLLEAMASGLAVVAAKVGDVPNLIRHGQTGFLVEPGDTEGLTATLLRLIKDTELRLDLGHQARVYVEANHSPNGLPGWLSRLYELALPPAPAPVAFALGDSSPGS